MTTHIIQGDARATGLAAALFHCVATSPPYFGLREYGDDDREIGDEPTPDEYIAEMRKVGREVWRVLRDDGTWWLNLGDSFAASGGHASHGKISAASAAAGMNKPTKAPAGIASKNLLMIPQRVALALQADGWIIRAQIPWIKANVMPESVRDRPTVAHEYVFLLAKSQRYFWDADAVRMPNVEPIRSTSPTRGQTAWSVNSSSHPQRDSNGGVGGNPAGRNLRTSDFFHAGLDEYAAHLAHVRENGGLLLSPNDDPLTFLINPVGNKLAHFAMWPPRLVAPMIKASTSEKGCCPKCGAQWARVVERPFVGDNSTKGRAYADTRNPSGRVPGSDTRGCPSYKGQTLGFSPSCKCNAGDPISCRVLDPFAGSGTTLQVCEALGRDSWGVELMEKNIPIIQARLAEKLDPNALTIVQTPRADERQRSLFGDDE